MTGTARRHVRRSPSDWQQLLDEQGRSGTPRSLATLMLKLWHQRPTLLGEDMAEHALTSRVRQPMPGYRRPYRE